MSAPKKQAFGKPKLIARTALQRSRKSSSTQQSTDRTAIPPQKKLRTLGSNYHYCAALSTSSLTDLKTKTI
jgi:hypothetical protein